MQTLREIKALLDSNGLRPNKSLGQNFLIDQNLLRKLVDASGVGAGDVVLEVGPGTGTLTEELLARGARVIACELDSGLATLLRDRFDSAREQFTLIEGDCLAGKGALHPEIAARLDGERFTLVANLPYGAASPLMVVLATSYAPRHDRGCMGQYVTVQKEVAQRLRAGPGSKDFGELGVIVQAMCDVTRIAAAPASCFWPQPKVNSELVSIKPRSAPLTRDPIRLGQTCRLLFQKRRKKLSTILRSSCIEAPDGIDVDARPEHLTILEIESIACRTIRHQGHHSA